MDAQQEAKAHGADIVKQWDSTLDGRTRATHRELDGQIRELDEPFEIHGKKAQAPGYFGDPAEDCNCRCYALTRSRFADDWDKEHGFTKMDNHTGELRTFKNAEDYESFKKQYWSKENLAKMQQENLENARKNDIIKENKPSVMNLQLFARDLVNQSVNSIRKGIESTERKILLHQNKIKHPEKYVSEWNKMNDKQKRGMIRHWEKEIKNFEEFVTKSKNELKKRGQ